MFKKHLLILLMVISVWGNAQNLTMYGNQFIAQSTRSNPAFTPNANFHFGLPLISSFGVGVVNTGFVMSDALKVVEGQTRLTMVDVLPKLAEDNYIGMDMELDLLSVGFRVKNSYFQINLTEKVDFNFDYSKNFMTFLSKGPGAPEFLGDSVLIDNTGFRFNHYRELGVSFSHKFNDALSIGFRPKLLFGLGTFQNDRTDIAFYTDPDDYELTVTTSLGISTAGYSKAVDNIENFDIVNYLTNTKNLGFGVDMGASYKVNNNILVSASMSDFGIIKWKEDAKRYYNNNAKFAYNGLDLNELLANQETYTEELSDSIQSIFALQESNQEFRTALSSKFHLSGMYQFNKTFSTSVLTRGVLFRNKLYPSFTLQGNMRLRNFLFASVSYSAMNRSYNNIGGSLALNLGTVQLYAASDNIFGVTRLDYTKNLNFRLGMNIVAAYKDNEHHMSKEDVKKMREERRLKGLDTDEDGVNDFDDVCPEIAGLVELNGCPDKDNDGVHDLADACPDLPGFPETNGCPDRDNDGTADKDDNCPDEYGLAGGCPDKDEDGIADKDDACPDAKGLAEMNGCPDSDGDGVADHLDKCPDVAGENEGCPDSDGDGVHDGIDECPKVPGSAELKGCTDKDTDHDGIPDGLDDCPYRSGTNNGCPE